MPQTISRSIVVHVIAGAFSKREKAAAAVAEFQRIGIPNNSIQMVFREEGVEQPHENPLLAQGADEAQMFYYTKAVEEGKTVVVVYDVVDPAPVIDIFDLYEANYNIDGSRNIRDDVAGMTVGAAVGAAALGAAGTVVAGPVGAALGIAAGVALGAGAGAAAGKESEHRK